LSSNAGSRWLGQAAVSTHSCPVDMQDNIFEWHFAIRGPPDTEFEVRHTCSWCVIYAYATCCVQFAARQPIELLASWLQGGIYHGRIILPPEYPFKPPSFIMVSPSGRFETGVKICLSMSSHHPEHWQPSWSVRVALVALIAFLPTSGHGAIGSLVRYCLAPKCSELDALWLMRDITMGTVCSGIVRIQVVFGAASCRTSANKRSAFLLLSHARRPRNTAVKPSSRSSTSCMLACWLQNWQVLIYLLKVLFA